MTAHGALRACGLFAGVGGIEHGLEQKGIRAKRMCEIDPLARAVLATHFPATALRGDIARMRTLPDCEILAAGFPCQDVSQAGLRAGVHGKRFLLVEHLFRLFDVAPNPPAFLLLENVPGLLRLRGGEAMRYLAQRFADRGLRWAYRTVDAQAFGIPQRRKRVLILASRSEDPVPILLGQDQGERPGEAEPTGYGFYWTEGFRGLGLAVDAVPPLKGGFGLGIPSAPAVWVPNSSVGPAFGVPDVRDLERLQGLPENWTKPLGPDREAERGRWRLIGNAVCAEVSAWAGERIANAGSTPSVATGSPVTRASAWPSAGWAEGSRRMAVDVSPYPVAEPITPIRDFLNHPLVPLSVRASRGFLDRAWRSNLTFPAGMREALQEHADQFEGALEAA